MNNWSQILKNYKPKLTFKKLKITKKGNSLKVEGKGEWEKSEEVMEKI